MYRTLPVQLQGVMNDSQDYRQDCKQIRHCGTYSIGIDCEADCPVQLLASTQIVVSLMEEWTAVGRKPVMETSVVGREVQWRKCLSEILVIFFILNWKTVLIEIINKFTKHIHFLYNINIYHFSSTNNFTKNPCSIKSIQNYSIVFMLGFIVIEFDRKFINFKSQNQFYTNSNLPRVIQNKQMNNTSIDPDLLAEETNQICNMCMATGIHKNVYAGENRSLSHMPVSLYPYELSQFTYEKLRTAHVIWVKLLVKVARDKQFVNRVFKETASSDEFVGRYLELYNKYLEKQLFGVACIRIDYMGDQSPQLVEYNLMSVGLNGMSDGVQRLANLYQKHRTTQEVFYPESNNQVTLLNAISSTLKDKKLDGVVLMVVHEKHQKQFNFGDQNAFELEALRRGLKVKRVSMTELIENYHLSEENDLYFQKQKVSAVYFRTAYSPVHYKTLKHWQIRQVVEKSNVLSIPSVSMQLVNFKRMQVELSKIEILKNYLPQGEAELIKSLTGELYDFEEPSKLQKLKELASTDNYVLKSNRQGGGNNYFGKEASQKLIELSKIPNELTKYILMNKINSKIMENVFIANYRYLQVKQCTSEFSTFGSFVYEKDELKFNVCGGHLIRLKKAEENEGGIAIDKAVIAGLTVVKTLKHESQEMKN